MSGFDQVIGYESFKEELIRYCDVLKNPEKYGKLGVVAPRGLVLYGEPGLGKTTMAHAFIEECGREVFTLRKDKPNGKFVNKIRDVFKKARESAPSIVFLDDMDKFANEDVEHRDAEEYVAVQAGIDKCKGHDVFVLATANSKWDFPDSLLRVGRFDKSMEIRAPKGEDAAAIIRYYLSKKNVADDLDVNLITRIMEGRSCAELETVVNEAGIFAGFENHERITQDEFIKACLAMLFDEQQKNNKYNDDDSEESGSARRVSIHEAGHAVVAEVLNPGSVSIIALNVAGTNTAGVTSCLKPKGFEYSCKMIESDILIDLAGRAATELVLGQLDIGCSDDIDHAVGQVENLVSGLYGAKFGWRRRESEVYLGTRDQNIYKAMEGYYQKAKEIVAENRGFLDSLIEELLQKTILTYKDIAIIKKNAN